MTIQDNEFFLGALYSSSSIPDAIDKYVEYLWSKADGKSYLHANKLKEYRELFSPNITLKLRSIFDGCYNELSEKLPDLRFRISARRKSLISLEQKIRKNLSENKSLDLIRDMLGARIVLLNGTEEDCYEVMDLLISLCLINGYTICEESLENKVSPFIAANKDKLLFLNQFYYGLTDYIDKPKANGYKSLHAVFKNRAGRFFEVQVRTFEMHVSAAFGSSNHEDYKKEKYQPIELDQTKINMPGYFYPLPSGSPMDLIGLQYSLELLQRNKTF